MKNAITHTNEYVQNDFLVSSEREGMARTMVQRHQTYANKDLRQRIKNMSILETIG